MSTRTHRWIVPMYMDAVYVAVEQRDDPTLRDTLLRLLRSIADGSLAGTVLDSPTTRPAGNRHPHPKGPPRRPAIWLSRPC